MQIKNVIYLWHTVNPYFCVLYCANCDIGDVAKIMGRKSSKSLASILMYYLVKQSKCQNIVIDGTAKNKGIYSIINNA